jgi:hypothetical protein
VRTIRLPSSCATPTQMETPSGLSLILSTDEPAGHKGSAAGRSAAGRGLVEFAGRGSLWAALAEPLYALDASVGSGPRSRR